MPNSTIRPLTLLCMLSSFGCAAEVAPVDSLNSDSVRTDEDAPAAQVSTIANQYLEIVGWDLNGSGCSDHANLDYVVLTDPITKEPYIQLDFGEQYKIVADKNITPQQKECEVVLDIKSKRQGLKFAVAKVEFYGYAILQAGTNASFWARYGWDQGSILPARETTKNFIGPKGVLTDDREFIVADTLPGVEWSRCNETRRFRINTRVQLSNPRKTDGEIMLNAVKGNFSTRVYAVTQPCSN